MNKKKLFSGLASIFYRCRQYCRKNLKLFARNTNNKRVLELGSGDKYKGVYIYSMKDLFNNSNEFIQSDIVKEYGHNIIDATKMKYKNEFDIVLCMNVLEHVYDFHKVIENSYNALRVGGFLIIFVPGFYPLHSEPDDYWRFTEHSFKKLLKKFSHTKIKHYGLREYPFGYYIEAIK